jgi:hypothetical protein
MSKCISEVLTVQRIYYLLRNSDQKLSTLASNGTEINLTLAA